jgi:hypothetical protein
VAQQVVGTPEPVVGRDQQRARQELQMQVVVAAVRLTHHLVVQEEQEVLAL